MKTLKLALASLIFAAPMASMADNSCPLLTGSFMKASETLIISQTSDEQGKHTYSVQSQTGGSVELAVGATKTESTSEGAVEQIVSCENNELVLISKMTDLDLVQKESLSTDNEGNLTELKLISVAGMPDQTSITVYPKSN